MSSFNDIKKNIVGLASDNDLLPEIRLKCDDALPELDIMKQSETDKNKISNLINNNPNLKNKFFTAKELLDKESKEISNNNELKRKNEEKINADNKKQKNINVYCYHEGENEGEQLKNIIFNAEIGDQVHYFPNNQLGIKYYEIIINKDQIKDLKLIGDYGGFFNDPDYLEY